MSTGDVFTGMLPLFLIIALLAGVMFLLKKYGYKIKRKNIGPVTIETIGTQMIMPKKYISVVNVAGMTLVLGISENSITLLKELTNINTSSPVQSGQQAEISSSFADILKKNIGIK